MGWEFSSMVQRLPIKVQDPRFSPQLLVGVLLEGGIEGRQERRERTNTKARKATYTFPKLD